MKTPGWLKQLICIHHWESQDIEHNSMDLAVALLHGDYCRCSHCGKEDWLTRQEYIDHLIATKRMKA